MCNSMGYGVRKIEKFATVDIIIEQASESNTVELDRVLFSFDISILPI